MAECILGRGAEAYDYWKKVSFIHRGREPEVFKAEPYVYSEFVHGPESPFYGLGAFSWMTGTASWMWKVCLDWILGVRAEIRGLQVDPCIPPEWDGFKVVRRFRKATYEIEVTIPSTCRRASASSMLTASGTTRICCRCSRPERRIRSGS